MLALTSRLPEVSRKALLCPESFARQDDNSTDGLELKEFGHVLGGESRGHLAAAQYILQNKLSTFGD